MNDKPLMFVDVFDNMSISKAPAKYKQQKMKRDVYQKCSLFWSLVSSYGFRELSYHKTKQNFGLKTF